MNPARREEFLLKSNKQVSIPLSKKGGIL